MLFQSDFVMLNYAATLNVSTWAKALSRRETYNEYETIRELMKRVESDKRFRVVNPELHASSIVCLNKMFRALIERRQSFASRGDERTLSRDEQPCEDALVEDQDALRPLTRSIACLQLQSMT
jgi:hypothetical protein